MRPIRWIRRGATLAGLGMAGGAAVITARHLLATPQQLEGGLAGEARMDERDEQEIYYNVAGPQDAPPLVLLHDFSPGASNFEFRRIFAPLAADHRVYAPDWLGFGMSERPAREYTGEFYAGQLAQFLRRVVGQPASVIARGLAANIAVRAASDAPALFTRLVLVSPHPLAGTAPGPDAAQILVRLAQRASLGLVPYAALSTRTALRWQLQRQAARPGEGGATDDAVDHLYASSHQFGGHHALMALLTGALDLPIQNAFALLEPPVLVVGGEQDTQHPYLELEDLVLLNPRAQMLSVPGAGGAVYEDEPLVFVERVTTWLSALRVRPGPEVELGLEADQPDVIQPDSIRQAMDAPEAPVPTTLHALTAPLDTGAPREDEGPFAPEHGPHPVPAEARDEPLDEPTGALEPEDEPVVMVFEPDASIGSARPPATAPDAGAVTRQGNGEAVAAARLSADGLDALEERAGAEAQRVDARIQDDAPGSVGDGPTTEIDAAPPPDERPSAAANQPVAADQPAPAERALRGSPREAAPHAERVTEPHRLPSQAGARSRGSSAAAGGRGARKSANGANAPGIQRAEPGAGGHRRATRKTKHGHK